MTHYYCSTFSKEYAYKGLLLYQSLRRWDKDFHFFFVCLHDEVMELFSRMDLKNATLISLSTVEQEDRQLMDARKDRNNQEYSWTAKASVLLYILNHYTHIDHIVWLDGDTYFFSEPDPIFNEWGQSSIMLNLGRWNKASEGYVERYGRYNTGLMGFKRDQQAIRCLKWFRRHLIEWCYAKHEKNLWSDQVYVNDWPERFNNVVVVKNLGINVTPPVVVDNKVAGDGKYVYINGQKLVFFHYSQFRYFDGNEFDLCGFVRNLSDNVLKMIYLPYVHACNSVMESIRKVDNSFYPPEKPKKVYIHNYFNLAANDNNGAEMANICTVLSKDYIIQALALYSSLKKHSSCFRFWVLCVDNTVYDLLVKMDLDGVKLISLDNIKTKKLARIQKKRQIHEFCWTLKASFMYFLMKNNVNLDSLLYVDADLFFFSDIKDIYSEWGNHSIYISKMRHARKWKKRLGKYSAGLVGFKRDQSGLRCLDSWRKKCLKWCYDRQKPGLWADQKYLNNWPQAFSGVKISESKGVNAGSWSIPKSFTEHIEDGVIYVDDDKLVCFHFSGFKIINENEFELCTWSKKAAMAEIIYSVYLDEIRKTMSWLKSEHVGSGYPGRGENK